MSMFGIPKGLNRRQMLHRTSLGFGMTALSHLLGQAPLRGESLGATLGRPIPGHRPRAKSVILAYMSGGVSHVDSFDPKPELQRRHGQPMPVPVQKTVFNNNGNIMPSPFEFKHYGESGIPISSMFPHVAECADDLAIVRSMTSKVSEHAQGNYAFHCTQPFSGFPSAGAWVSYGLGNEADNLPSFVVLNHGNIPHGGVSLYGSGFLPANNQASFINPDAAEPLRHVHPKESVQSQMSKLDLIERLDRKYLEQVHRDAQVEAAIQNYEMAYRMQSAVPELCDLRGESEITKRLYGLEDADAEKAAFAKQCLLARRLVERGVRFIELSCLTKGIGAGGAANPWDQHGKIKEGHGAMAYQVDQPLGALLKDLKARGLLDDTLVIWAGEFGRTPFSQGSDGRDHNPSAYTIWMAGGGIKGGSVYGQTDEFGYHVVDGALEIYDLWATVLHLLGHDHEKLTYRFSGRDYRLTDVHGRVIHDILM